MNRRGFISMLAGAAGAPLIPWRGLDEPHIFLPPRSGWPVERIEQRFGGTFNDPVLSITYDGYLARFYLNGKEIVAEKPTGEWQRVQSGGFSAWMKRGHDGAYWAHGVAVTAEHT